jgi:hypothetical protein
VNMVANSGHKLTKAAANSMWSKCSGLSATWHPVATPTRGCGMVAGELPVTQASMVSVTVSVTAAPEQGRCHTHSVFV